MTCTVFIKQVTSFAVEVDTNDPDEADRMAFELDQDQWEVLDSDNSVERIEGEDGSVYEWDRRQYVKRH